MNELKEETGFNAVTLREVAQQAKHDKELEKQERQRNRKSPELIREKRELRTEYQELRKQIRADKRREEAAFRQKWKEGLISTFKLAEMLHLDPYTTRSWAVKGLIELAHTTNSSRNYITEEHAREVVTALTHKETPWNPRRNQTIAQWREEVASKSKAKSKPKAKSDEDEVPDNQLLGW